jgi:multidrug efflux pump subunit AcrB
MPSALGFVSLAGIVVNDSILLVLFLKTALSNGTTVEKAANEASRARFRAILLTSLTTIAGLLPLLFETDMQAQVLIPMATSVAFGIMTSTLLVLVVVPCLYGVLSDIGLSRSPRRLNSV